MEQGKLQGWQADPFGLHEKRYFSDGRPTKLVRDGAAESYDEPPNGESPPSGATEPAASSEPEAAPETVTASGTTEPTAIREPEAAPETVTADGTTEPTASSEPEAAPETVADEPQPGHSEIIRPELGGAEPDGSAVQAELEPVLAMADAASAEADPVESESDTTSLATEPALDAVALADGDASAGESPYRGLTVFVTRRRSGRVYALVAVAAVAVIVAIVAITGAFSSSNTNLGVWNGTGTNAGGGSGSNAEVASLGMAPAAFVTTSAHKTLAKKTATVTLVGTALVSGHMVALQGTGQVDLAHNAVSITISGSYPGGTVTETEILAGGKFYLQLSANGKSLTWANGHRHWMEIPIAQSGAQYITSVGPVSPLRLLEQQGAQVTTIGTRQIGGLTCSGFSVTPTRQATITDTKQEWAHIGLTKAQESVALKVLQSATPPTITVWFDPRHQLECGASVQLQVSSPGATAATSTVMMMTFTHYGVPVHIVQPASSDSVLF